MTTTCPGRTRRGADASPPAGAAATAAQLTHYRIDATHSNAFAAWQRLGSPAQPDGTQYARIKAAGQLGLMAEAAPTVLSEGGAALRFPLPRQAVSLAVLEWP